MLFSAAKSQALLIALACAVILPTAFGQAQESAPAEYQVIRVQFRVLDLDGRPLEKATVAATLDPDSANRAPDRVLRAKTAGDDYVYSQDDQRGTVFSNEQVVDAQGFCRVPFVVYSNRSEPVDYELNVQYEQAGTNVIARRDAKQSFTGSSNNSVLTIHTSVRRKVATSLALFGVIALLCVTIIGALLFFRGVYPRLIDGGRGIDLSRALCWSGVLFVFLLALGVLYWWLLPYVLGMWVFLALLFIIWFVHFLVTVLPRRSQA